MKSNVWLRLVSTEFCKNLSDDDDDDDDDVDDDDIDDWRVQSSVGA